MKSFVSRAQDLKLGPNTVFFFVCLNCPTLQSHTHTHVLWYSCLNQLYMLNWQLYNKCKLWLLFPACSGEEKQDCVFNNETSFSLFPNGLNSLRSPPAAFMTVISCRLYLSANTPGERKQSSDLSIASPLHEPLPAGCWPIYFSLLYNTIPASLPIACYKLFFFVFLLLLFT